MESFEGKITPFKIWKFVRELKMEVFLVMLIVSGILRSNVGTPLTQDKICITTLHQPASVCFNVTSSGDREQESIKDEIIKESLNFNLYSKYITTVPSLIYAMFLGSWSDRFPKGRKIMLYAGCVGILIGQAIDMVNVIYFDIPAPYLLVSILPGLFLGGGVALQTAINSEILNNTPNDMRALRMAVMQVIFGATGSFLTLAPAYMLEAKPWFFPDRLRNYVGVYTVSSIVFAPAIFWLHFMIKVKDPRGDLDSADFERFDEDSPLAQKMRKSWFESVKRVFDLENVKMMYRSATKKRPNGERKLLWILIVGHCLASLAGAGNMEVEYQFVEKLFNWTNTRNANFQSVFNIVNLVVPIVIIPFFLRTLKMSLPVMGMVGTFFGIFAMLTRGAYLTEYGFYLSYVIGIPSGVSMLASRTFLANLIDNKEIGSVWAAICCIDAVMPLATNLIITNMFNATLDTAPGTVFLFTAFVMFFNFCIFIYAELHTMKKTAAKETKHSIQ